MKGFQIHGWRGGVGGGLGPEYPRSPFEQLHLPQGDLIGMDIKLLGQFGQRLLALDCRHSHFCLESRCVVPARSFAHCLSCSTAILAALSRNSTYLAVQIRQTSSIESCNLRKPSSVTSFSIML